MVFVTSQFGSCAVTTSKVSLDPEPTKSVWVLEGLDDADIMRTLLCKAKMVMEIEDEESGYQLEFRLKKGTNRGKEDSTLEYLQLMVNVISSTVPESMAAFYVKVDSLEGSKPAVNIPKAIIYMKQSSGNTFVGNLILLSMEPSYSNRSSTNPKQDYTKDISKTFSIGIAVAPIKCNAVRTPGELDLPALNTGFENPPSDSSLLALSKDFERLAFDGEDAYSDIKLKSQDGFVISAHKFVLVARCPRFREIIEAAEKQNGFDGTVSISDINGKSIMALLYWMYTGKLQNGVEYYIDELIAAAVKYEIPKFLELLDKELVKICSVDNMLELFLTAKKNGMEIAMNQVSKFIKENI